MAVIVAFSAGLSDGGAEQRSAHGLGSRSNGIRGALCPYWNTKNYSIFGDSRKCLRELASHAILKVPQLGWPLMPVGVCNTD